MKKLFLITFFLVLASVAVYSQQADTDPTTGQDAEKIEEIIDQALDAEFEVLPQEYPSKNIGFKVKIKSQIDSGRVAVQWYYPTTQYKIIGAEVDSITVVTGSEVTLEKHFSPIIVLGEKRYNKTYPLGIKISALTYTKNYLTIKKINFNIDPEFQLLPLTDSYRSSKTEFEINKIIINILIAGVIMLVIGLVIGRFLAYLNSDDTVK